MVLFRHIKINSFMNIKYRIRVLGSVVGVLSEKFVIQKTLPTDHHKCL